MESISERAIVVGRVAVADAVLEGRAEGGVGEEGAECLRREMMVSELVLKYGK